MGFLIFLGFLICKNGFIFKYCLCENDLILLDTIRERAISIWFYKLFLLNHWTARGQVKRMWNVHFDLLWERVGRFLGQGGFFLEMKQKESFEFCEKENDFWFWKYLWGFERSVIEAPNWRILFKKVTLT